MSDTNTSLTTSTFDEMIGYTQVDDIDIGKEMREQQEREWMMERELLSISTSPESPQLHDVTITTCSSTSCAPSIMVEKKPIEEEPVQEVKKNVPSFWKRMIYTVIVNAIMSCLIIYYLDLWNVDIVDVPMDDLNKMSYSLGAVTIMSICYLLFGGRTTRVSFSMNKKTLVVIGVLVVIGCLIYLNVQDLLVSESSTQEQHFIASSNQEKQVMDKQSLTYTITVIHEGYLSLLWKQLWKVGRLIWKCFYRN
jgi:hypothetical protein